MDEDNNTQISEEQTEARAADAEPDMPAEPAEAESPAPDQTDGEEPTEQETEEPKKNRVAAFFGEWGAAIIFLGALAFVCVLLGLAIGFKGDIYDKVAFIWVAAFVCELIAYLRHKSGKALAATIIVGVLAICSAVAYGLEVAGIIP